MRKSFSNKMRSIMIIRLDIKYPVVLDCLSSLKKVHNLINIFVFEQFQLLKTGLKSPFFRVSL